MSSYDVLIVEDEPLVAADLAETLEKLGYRISAVVDSGVDAIRRAEKWRPSLVLMDIGLKGEIDGVIAAAYIHDKLNIPIVYLTGNADEEVVERVKVTNPYGFLLKPFKEIELKMAIEIAIYKHYTIAAKTDERQKQMGKNGHHN